ncbi:MAG: hypothetical protein ACRD3Q_21250 [Terriglobales bacterium]
MKLQKLAFFILGTIVLASGDTSRSHFQGEISDSQCAMNVHSLKRSHAEMIAKRTLGTDSASCARACVRRGGEWVLRSGDDVYHLKNQAGIEQFAGRKVEVDGTLDPKTQTIDNLGVVVIPTARSQPH